MDSKSGNSGVLPTWAIDEIWEQWNQSNELCGSTNLPTTLRQGNDEDALFKQVFDSEFKYLYDVPQNLVVHTPPARLNITRLVACRNYRPHEPNSCPMGAGCKFVHADVDYTLLEGHPIHVNYIWRHEGLCAYERLPPGELVEVLSDDMSTVNSVRSELILVTRGALARFDIAEPLIRCKYFDLNQTCFTGERCNFLHIISVDPTAQGDFKRTSRATAVSGAPTGSSLTHPNEGSTGTCSTRTTNKEDSTTTKTMCGAGNQDTRPSSSSWVPNPDLAPFEPSTAKQYAIPRDVMTPSGLPPNALQDQLRRNDTYLHGIPGLATSVLNNYLQDMQPIPGVPGFERAITPQEQLNYLISQLVPVIVDQLSARSARTITVAPSPLLDVPSSVGTLLFLPRGVSEAVAVHPVPDTSFLCRVMMLGAEAGYSVSAADRQQQAMRMGVGTGWWQPHGVQGGCSGDAFPANWSNIR